MGPFQTRELAVKYLQRVRCAELDLLNLFYDLYIAAIEHVMIHIITISLVIILLDFCTIKFVIKIHSNLKIEADLCS